MEMNCAHVVETMSRLGQWRFDDISSSNFASMTNPLYGLHKSDSFKIGKWDWYFILNGLSEEEMIIMLAPVVPDLDSPLIASFNFRVISFLAGRKTIIHPEVRDMPMKYGDFHFIWRLDRSLMTGRLIIEVEFLDLKTESPNGGEPCSIWSDGYTQKDTDSTSLSFLARMLSESIHTDITICASDGSIEAHRAVLAARSPVFHSMFTHDLKEKEMSSINISDMSIEACRAFLNYIYSNLPYEDFFNHRLNLLIASDKYDISDLKDACEESLIQDIDTNNVLERLQSASMYFMPKLKLFCIQYLVKFGKIFDLKEEFNAFMKYADRELVGEVVNEMLSVWKEF